MDKEAREKIFLETRLSESEISKIAKFVDSVDGKRIAEAQIRRMMELGYRKLPKDKPSLLSDGELDEIYIKAWEKRNTSVDSPLELKTKDGDEELAVLGELAQAQREADIKHYED